MRKLGIPLIMDRIVSQIVNSVFAEIFDPEFTKSNYWFQTGHSQHPAIQHIQKIIREGYEHAKARRTLVKMTQWQSVKRRVVRFVMNLRWFSNQGFNIPQSKSGLPSGYELFCCEGVIKNDHLLPDY